jgi:hypothetical protein
MCWSPFIWTAERSRDTVRQWFAGLGRVTPVAGFVGRHRVWLANLLFLDVMATQVFGAITGRTDVTVIPMLNLVVGLLVFETFPGLARR